MKIEIIEEKHDLFPHVKLSKMAFQKLLANAMYCAHLAYNAYDREYFEDFQRWAEKEFLTLFDLDMILEIDEEAEFKDFKNE